MVLAVTFLVHEKRIRNYLDLTDDYLNSGRYPLNELKSYWYQKRFYTTSMYVSLYNT